MVKYSKGFWRYVDNWTEGSLSDWTFLPAYKEWEKSVLKISVIAIVLRDLFKKKEESVTPFHISYSPPPKYGTS